MAEVKKVRLKSELPLNLEIEDLIWRKGFTNIAGIDEAGCGPLAGPVVAAAIVFQPYFHIPAVKDSSFMLTPIPILVGITLFYWWISKSQC